MQTMKFVSLSLASGLLWAASNGFAADLDPELYLKDCKAEMLRTTKISSDRIDWLCGQRLYASQKTQRLAKTPKAADGASVAAFNPEQLRSDCEADLFEKSKMSGTEIKTLCSRKVLDAERAQPGWKERPAPAVSCEVYTEREVVCGGKRYVRDRGSILDTDNRLKQVLDRVSDDPDNTRGEARSGKAR